MKIIYNPESGAPITDFRHGNIRLNPFYPDKYEYMKDGVAQIANGLLQAEDTLADKYLETFAFLNEITIAQAKEILDRPQNQEFKCEEPGCEFKTYTKIALSGHKRKHDKERELNGKPLVDATMIPVAGGRKLPTLTEVQKAKQNNTDLPNGTDQDGVDWYGEDLKVENHSQDSFSGQRKAGEGHFLG